MLAEYLCRKIEKYIFKYHLEEHKKRWERVEEEWSKYEITQEGSFTWFTINCKHCHSICGQRTLSLPAYMNMPLICKIDICNWCYQVEIAPKISGLILSQEEIAAIPEFLK